MNLDSQHLKEIFNSEENDKEFPVRIYNSYNLFTVSKVVLSKGTMIIFTGDADNIEPVGEMIDDEDGPLIA